MYVVSDTKQEQAYQAIRSRIIEGDYLPGHRLVIDTLARELGVSGVPVREAFRRLEAEGLIVFAPNVGAQVATHSAARWHEILSALAVVEAYATADAAPHLEAADLAALRETNAAMLAAIEDLEVGEAGNANRRFHALIVDRCPNAYLAGLVRQAWDQLDLIRHAGFSFLPKRGRVSVGEHDELLALIERDPDDHDAIEKLARQHRQRTIEAYLRERARTEAARA